MPALCCLDQDLHEIEPCRHRREGLGLEDPMGTTPREPTLLAFCEPGAKGMTGMTLGSPCKSSSLRSGV